MKTDILTQNGQVLHRSTYRLLTLNELSDQEGEIAQEQFMATVPEKLGLHDLARD